MAANAAVVIPAYKEELNEFEKISLMQVQKVLGGKYPIIFAAPEGKNFSYFSAGNHVIYFPQQFFQSTQTYNALMKTEGFYKTFLEYEYILIYQLDAFVFSDKLEYFCSLGYDNIGAPWLWQYVAKIYWERKNFYPRVGNGGFCLRNVKACLEFLKNHSDWVEKLKKLPEDVFWSICGMIEGSNFRTAPISVAYKFSSEHLPLRCIKKNGGELPFGCHAWHNFSADFYIKAFSNFGYDLNQFKNQLKNLDLNGTDNFLINVAYQRLNRRINKGQSLMRYLTRKDFASVRVIRTPYNMLILARLLLENNSLSDKIFFYDESESDILINDLCPEKLPHLLLATVGGADTPFIETLQQKGLAYGKRFVTFHREYLIACEKMFRKLGK